MKFGKVTLFFKKADPVKFGIGGMIRGYLHRETHERYIDYRIRWDRDALKVATEEEKQKIRSWLQTLKFGLGK